MLGLDVFANIFSLCVLLPLEFKRLIKNSYNKQQYANSGVELCWK